MKQGKVLIRVIMILFLFVVLCYVGYAVYGALHDPLTTSVVIEYEAGEACFTTGYVLRDESVLTSRYPITVLSRSEGEKVGAGQAVAVGYLDDTAQQRQSRIDELTAQLNQLRYAYSTELAFSDIAALESRIAGDLASMAASVNRRDFTGAATTGAELKSLVLRRYSDTSDAATIQSEITELSAQLQSLTDLAGSDTRTITAGRPGYFSGSADGFETLLRPDAIDSLTVSALETLEESVAPLPEGAFGKLISGNTWYYATVVPSEYAAQTSRGGTVTVTFSQDLAAAVTMTVERIGASENGRCVLVLSCGRYMADVTLLRRVSADVVFSSYSGLRVPKNAIRLSESGTPGVYILEGSTARWKSVSILYDNGESYVVELDKSNTANLWPGDEVIVEAKGLYNGKVVLDS